MVPNIDETAAYKLLQFEQENTEEAEEMDYVVLCYLHFLQSPYELASSRTQPLEQKHTEQAEEMKYIVLCYLRFLLFNRLTN